MMTEPAADPLRLAIRHVTSYSYDPPAAGATMRLRLWPTTFASQVVEEWHVAVDGEQVVPNLTDACGVAEGVWVRQGVTTAMEVVAEGIVRREDDQGVVRGLKERMPPAVFVRPTALTTADEAVRELASQARTDDRLTTLHNIAGAVRDAVDYQTDTTDMATSAAAALAQGAGVCQDHAHVFIAAARTLGLPARYVAGYYMAGDDQAFETHGWAEGFVEGLGWVGFDISNRTCPTREHVRVASHLDAGRVSLISGAVAGQTEETLTATVSINQAQQ